MDDGRCLLYFYDYIILNDICAKNGFPVYVSLAGLFCLFAYQNELLR